MSYVLSTSYIIPMYDILLALLFGYFARLDNKQRD